MRRHVLIIGYGNPLRTDDGLGWQAVQRLAASLKHAPVEALAVHQLTPELGESIRSAGLVIFIDASHEGQPGTWTCAPVEPDTIPSRRPGRSGSAASQALPSSDFVGAS